MSFKKPRNGTRSDDIFYAHLFSNATNENSDNTTTRFTNTLGKTVYLDPQENWHVALVSILCSNKFTTKLRKKIVFSSYALDEGQFQYSSLTQISVRCSLISHPFDGSGIFSVHSRNPFNRDDKRVHFYEPHNLIYFKVNSSIINDIEITLLDSNLKQLSLARGLATSCTLKFMKMSDEDIVPLFVNSHAVGSESNNKSNHFITHFPNYFNNYSTMKWMICIHSISYRPEFVLIPSHIVKNCFFSLFEWPDSSFDGEQLTSNDLFDDADIPYETTENRLYITDQLISTWSNETDLRKFINGELLTDLKSEKGNPLSDFVEFERLLYTGLNPIYNKPITMKLIKPCLFFMPEFFANICGFRNGPKHEAPPEYQSAILYKCLPNRPKRIRARARIDVYHYVPHSISILTDCIEASIMGNVFTTIIKTFPIMRTYDGKTQSETIESKNLEWHTLNTRELRSMSFQLLDHSGHLIEFVNNNQNIHLSMMVKKFS